MSKEVATKQSALPSVDVTEWGDTGVTLGQDIVLAKILPMQPSSVLVGDGKAQIGEFRDSLAGTKIGSIAEPFEILPFHVEKMWDILEEGDDGQYAWARTMPVIENPILPGYNDNLPWSGEENGVSIKRVRRFNFYVMLPSELKNGQSVPYVFSFKSTSYREGKKMFTQMYLRNKVAKLPPPGYTFKIGGIKNKNDKNQTWVVPTVELGRPSTVDEMNACLEWFKQIKKGAVKVDDSDLQETADATSDGEGTGNF